MRDRYSYQEKKELHKLTESAQCFGLQDVLLGSMGTGWQDESGKVCKYKAQCVNVLIFYSISLFFLRLHSVCLAFTTSQRPFICARSILASLWMFTIWCSSDDWAPMIFFTQTNKSTFIIQCDKLTWKMSATFYTYVNFCVRSPSACLFCSRSIAEGFKVHMRVHFLSTPSDRSPSP